MLKRNINKRRICRISALLKATVLRLGISLLAMKVRWPRCPSRKLPSEWALTSASWKSWCRAPLKLSPERSRKCRLVSNHPVWMMRPPCRVTSSAINRGCKLGTLPFQFMTQITWWILTLDSMRKKMTKDIRAPRSWTFMILKTENNNLMEKLGF